VDVTSVAFTAGGSNATLRDDRHTADLYLRLSMDHPGATAIE
jgi:hypothetical protein